MPRTDSGDFENFDEVGKLPYKEHKVVPVKKTRPIAKVEDIEPENYNSRMVSLMVEIAKWPRVSLVDPEAFDERVDQYFNLYIEMNAKPTVASLCLALGISSGQYQEWLNGETIYNPKQQESLRRAHQILEALTETYLIDGKGYPVSIIFDLKNRFGFKDTSERVLSVQTGYSNDNLDAIREQYMQEKTISADDIIDNDEFIDEKDEEPL